MDQGRKAFTPVKTWIGERGCYHSLLPSVTSRSGHALDRGMQWWLGHVISIAAAYFSGDIVAAATLFALSYWLLRSLMDGIATRIEP